MELKIKCKNAVSAQKNKASFKHK